jgi:hypothetical protein
MLLKQAFQFHPPRGGCLVNFFNLAQQPIRFHSGTEQLGCQRQWRAAATIAVGTTTTGAAGTNATVTNTGTTSAAVFNFTIPQGVAGANGSAGATGATGPAGPTGPAGSGLTYAPFSLAASAGGVLNETANWTFAVMNAGTIQACGSVATIAPTGAAMIVDVLKNGMSIFGANPKTTVAVSSTAYAEVTVFSSASVAKGDLITAKLTQADSNSVGQFVRVTCSIQ